MLNKLGLPDYEQKVGTLSGGQRGSGWRWRRR